MLARTARSVLDTKTQIHKAAGRVSGWMVNVLDAGNAARAFTEELASNLPLGPIDAKMVAVARGLQVTGIMLRVMDNKELTSVNASST